MQWLEFHVNDPDKNQKMTSDEERETPKRKVLRKRLKKRSRVFTRSSDDNDEDSENHNFITESFTENSENRIKSLETQKKVESIIPKMLMKPESLVALNLVKKNSQNVEKIIKVS